MKATEFMIGDWYSNSNGDYCKVIKNFGDKVWGQGSDVSDSTDNPQPIPLTPEILEKNGFVPSKHDFRKFSFHDIEKRVEIIVWFYNGKYEKPMNILKNEYLEDETSYTLPEPSFVHQYQHALRLCGFDELADNFQI